MSAGGHDYVVLFKAISESENNEEDVYVNTFRSANFQVNLIPVLDFEFVNLDKLFIKLTNPDDYEGIIFTSPRCVTGVELAVENEDKLSVLEKWQNHKHFVVGEKTAQMLEEINFVSEGKEAGNSSNLVEIMAKGQYKKPFLYPKGSLTKDTFKVLLKENNINVDEILIYETIPHAELEHQIENLKSQSLHKNVYFVYFSPSGANFTLPLIRKHHFDLNQIKFVAIGPTTKESIQENGFSVSATSAKPDPQALLNAILTLKKSVMSDFSFILCKKSQL